MRVSPRHALHGIVGTALLASLAASGACLLSPGPESPPGTEDDGTVPGEDFHLGSAQRAFFILTGAHLRAPDWPEAFASYDLFVCDPSLPQGSLDRIRAEVPGALCLAYTNAQDVRIGKTANPYFRALDAAFDSTLCIRNLLTGNVVRIYGHDPADPGAGIPAFILQRESADVLADFHRDVTMQVDWDGIYIDQCTRHFPGWRKTRLRNVAPLFDIDGDGRPDDFTALDRQYETWRPYFTEQMRRHLGDGTIVVGNSGGGLRDRSLNGITLESVGERFTVEEVRQYLRSQMLVAQEPFLGVLWVKDGESGLPARALAREFAGVHFGEAN